MTAVENSLLEFYRRLGDTKIPRMIAGAVASMVYGEPRATIDVDIVVDARPKDPQVIESVFPRDRYLLPPSLTCSDPWFIRRR